MFIKNDNSFTCINCNNEVKKLEYTSRDHCNHCLYSLHVDITPGDRKNECKGVLVPINSIEKYIGLRYEEKLNLICDKLKKGIYNFGEFRL